MPAKVKHTLEAELRTRSMLQTELNRATLNRWRPPERNARIIGLYQELLRELSFDDLSSLEIRDAARSSKKVKLDQAARDAERRARRRGTRRKTAPAAAARNGKKRAA